jgi:hypothetical protein
MARRNPLVADGRWVPATAVAGAIAFSALAWLGAGSARAADPSPSSGPLVFHNPQYLVFMESHQTMDGPVEDDAYWLYVAPPEPDGHLVVPAGDGSVWHYQARLVGGPFRGEAEACPQMLAVGVTSLEAWRVAAGEEAQVVDCGGYVATPEPVAPAPAMSPGGVAPGRSAEAPSDEPDPASLGIAVALIGALLFGGGFVLGREPRSPSAALVEFGPGARSDVDPGPADPPFEFPTDPCFEQAEMVDLASRRGRYLNDLLATCRRYEALLQEQIDVLANLVLPGSVLLDVGMAAGGLSGGIVGPLGRKLIASEGFRWAVGEAVVKDVLKELGKQALGGAGGGLNGGKAYAEGRKSAIKQTILEGAAESVLGIAEKLALTPDVARLGETVVGPIKEGLGSLYDLYEGVGSGLEMKERLDKLRGIRDRIADRRVELEIELEDAIEAQRFAAERLAHCRTINSPDWRP